MKAIILAGGFGRRLKVKTAKIPKPMLRIGGTPILASQIELLKQYGIKDITILTHYLSEVIEKYFGNGQKFGVNINYFREEKPLGTAGGVKEIAKSIKHDFLLLSGDVVMNLDIAKLVNFHKKKKGIGTLVLHPNDHPYDSDLVEIGADQRITVFHLRPHPDNAYFHNLGNAGLYVFSPRILKYIKKGEKADWTKDIFPKIVKKEALYGYLTAEYLKDMGTIERLNEVNKDFRSGKVLHLNRHNPRKAIFLDRDGTINDTAHDVDRPENFKLFPNAPQAIKKINESEFLAIVITNQPAVAKGFCSIDTINEIHKKMESDLGKEGAKLDAIYFCPHHPDQGFPGEVLKYKIECSCRKPKIGMVKKAAKDFNIDLKHSYFIGDSSRFDILCGRSAGLTTIGVKTGIGCQDGEARPDFLKKDILTAVNFILRQNK